MAGETVQHWTPVAFLDGDPVPYVKTAEGNFVALSTFIGSGGVFRARNVHVANVADLGVFTPYDLESLDNDDVTNVEGDVVLLTAQTTANENGPYVVGVIDPDTLRAPLTRPDWWATGAVIDSGTEIVVGGEGTVYKNTVWAVMASADSIIVDTGSPVLYPKILTGSTVLANETPSGSVTIRAPIFSGNTYVGISRTDRAAGFGSTALTKVYAPTNNGVQAYTAGGPGVGQVIVQACLANGNLNNADGSTINYVIMNGLAGI